MKKILSLFAASLVMWAGLTLAANTPNPMSMLKSTTDTLLSTLRSNQTRLKQNPSYIYKVVDNILLPKVNVRVMSMSVLGRRGWAAASPSERDQFVKTFTETVVKTYASALNAYTDEEIRFYPIRGGFQGRRILQINSQITRPSGPPVPVSYSVVLQNNQWKVYDLNVEGISLLQSFRSQFATQLAQGDNLLTIIKNLKVHNAKMN